MKKLFLLLIVSITWTSFTNAQNPRWINYTNGNIINDLADENNILWVATNGGLAKLNKTTGDAVFYNKANSGLPENHVRSIAIDENGTKWIGTEFGGLAAYNENGFPDWIGEKIKAEQLFDVYPNPATNTVHIEPLSEVKITYLEIIDMQGKLVKHQRVDNDKKATLVIKGLPKGVYILKIHSDQGVLSSKLIKE